MLFLLSSDYSTRYKQDILRCLAAPIGASLQFRYDKVDVSGTLFDKLVNPASSFPQDGIVCSVASKGTGVLPVVPIRTVKVQRPRVHGQTISVTLVADKVVLGDHHEFTKVLHELSGKKSPQVKEAAQGPEGSYFFESELPGGTELGDSVALWEKTVAALREQHAYKDEQFFWVALGIESTSKALDTSKLHSWPISLATGQNYKLLIYHFQPRGGAKPDTKMEVSWGTLLQSVTPADTRIDSRYDLKSWWFNTNDNTQKVQPTWIRIRSADSWDMDLTLAVRSSYWRPVISGALVAVPAILALVPQALDLETKVILGGAGVIVGVVSSYLARSRST